MGGTKVPCVFTGAPRLDTDWTATGLDWGNRRETDDVTTSVTGADDVTICSGTDCETGISLSRVTRLGDADGDLRLGVGLIGLGDPTFGTG